MIEYSLRSISADELSFKMTPVQIQPNTRLSVNPRFSRRISQAKENPEAFLVMLECVIEGTEQAPFPYRAVARFLGAFEVKNMVTDEDRRIFSVNATETMFPYLRAAIANLTADALTTPLQLPTVPGSTLFKEDRELGHYTMRFDSDTVN